MVIFWISLLLVLWLSFSSLWAGDACYSGGNPLHIMLGGWRGVLLDRGPLSWTVCLKRAHSVEQDCVCLLLLLSSCGSLSGLKGALTGSRRLVLHHKTPHTLINGLAPQHFESIGISQGILGLSDKEAVSKLSNTNGARKTEKAARHSQTERQGNKVRLKEKPDRLITLIQHKSYHWAYVSILTWCIAEQRLYMWFFISFHIAHVNVKDSVFKAPKMAVYMF